ncbi:MAG: BrnT family toxin [Gammaproteobacteria bacterium]|nr:BrnT family toxin [Gammaproteobacteria bacterium]
MTYDSGKRRRNQREHKVDLADCEAVFDEPMLTREDTREQYGEERLVSLGWLQGKVVVLIWIDREKGPRLVSCRIGTPRMRSGSPPKPNALLWLIRIDCRFATATLLE